MKRRIATALLALGLVLPFVPLRAQQAQSWIHVRVLEVKDGTKVSVNLPLSLAQVALDVAPKDVFEKGRLKLSEKNIKIADLRRLWAEVKATGDADFVTVEEKDQTVHVTREGNFLRVDVKDLSDKKESVQVRMPVAVVDALLSGDGESMDVAAAIAQLKGQHGEIVSVEGSSQVRVWIDDSRT